MAQIKISKKEANHLIFLLERENGLLSKTILTLAMGEDEIADYKNIINMNNITLSKLKSPFAEELGQAPVK